MKKIILKSKAMSNSDLPCPIFCTTFYYIYASERKDNLQ